MPAECKKKYVFLSLEIASYFCVHSDKILKVEAHQEKRKIILHIHLLSL